MEELEFFFNFYSIRLKPEIILQMC